MSMKIFLQDIREVDMLSHDIYFRWHMPYCQVESRPTIQTAAQKYLYIVRHAVAADAGHVVISASLGILSSSHMEQAATL